MNNEIKLKNNKNYVKQENEPNIPVWTENLSNALIINTKHIEYIRIQMTGAISFLIIYILTKQYFKL